MTKRKAIFFDRDGIVNFRVVGEYINREENFHFIPDFLEILPKVKKLGFLAILVSNQKGVGKGLMTNEELFRINDFMIQRLMELTGESFDDIFYCTDISAENSFNLKPNPGMLLDAVEKWNIDIQNSWMVGDTDKDIIAGKRVGLKTVLIGLPEEEKSEPDFAFPSLIEFYKILI